MGYLRELASRRVAIVKSIDDQGKPTPALCALIERACTKQEFEDLCLPHKLKRRTKRQIACEAGIGPLADRLLANPALSPAEEAAGFVAP